MIIILTSKLKTNCKLWDLGSEENNITHFRKLSNKNGIKIMLSFKRLHFSYLDEWLTKNTWLPREGRKELPNKSAHSPEFVFSLGFFSLCMWESDIRKPISFPEWPEKDALPWGYELCGWMCSMRYLVWPQCSSNHVSFRLWFVLYSVWCSLVLICTNDFP